MLRDMSEKAAKLSGKEERDWQLRAECAGADPSIFFHPEGERGKAREQRIKRAKEFCRACTVLEQCREYALKAEEPYGIWGGMSEAERQRARWAEIRRRRAKEDARYATYLGAAHASQSRQG